MTTELGPQAPTAALLLTPQPPELQPPDLQPQLDLAPAEEMTDLPPPRQPPSLQPPPVPQQPVKLITAARAASMNIDRIFQVLLKSGSALLSLGVFPSPQTGRQIERWNSVSIVFLAYGKASI